MGEVRHSDIDFRFTTIRNYFETKGYGAPNQAIFPTHFHGLLDFLYGQRDFLYGQLNFLYFQLNTFYMVNSTFYMDN